MIAHAFGVDRRVTEVEAGAERDFAVAEIEPDAAAPERLVEGVEQPQRLEPGGGDRRDRVDDEQRGLRGRRAGKADDDEVPVPCDPGESVRTDRLPR